MFFFWGGGNLRVSWGKTEFVLNLGKTNVIPHCNLYRGS